jgi:hypothetical protein
MPYIQAANASRRRSQRQHRFPRDSASSAARPKRSRSVPVRGGRAGHRAVSVEPAARRLFGDARRPCWVAPLWQDLARRSAALPFRADSSEEHAAALWLRAGDWVAAADAACRIESWRRIPAALGWMAEARYRAERLDEVWPLLAELAWLAPKRFDALAARLGDDFSRTLAQALRRELRRRGQRGRSGLVARVVADRHAGAGAFHRTGAAFAAGSGRARNAFAARSARARAARQAP